MPQNVVSDWGLQCLPRRQLWENGCFIKWSETVVSICFLCTPRSAEKSVQTKVLSCGWDIAGHWNFLETSLSLYDGLEND